MNENEIFNVGQKAFIRKGDELLIIGDPIEGLDFPGGRIQKGEDDIIESLKREVKEETGLDIKVGEPFVTWVSTYPEGHELEGKKVYLVGYRCQYVAGEVVLSNEHDKFSWVTKDNYQQVNDGTPWFERVVEYFS